MKSACSIPTLSESSNKGTVLSGHLHAGPVSDQLIPVNRRSWHRHPYFEIFWINQGQGEHLNDFHHYAFQAGTLIFVSIGQMHTWQAWHEVRGYMAGFSTEDIAGLENQAGRAAELPFFFGLSTKPILPVPKLLWPEFDRLFAALVGELAARDPLGHEAARAWLKLVLIRSQRCFIESGGGEFNQSAASTLTRHFMLELERQFRHRRRVRDYAARLQVTPHHLIETVRQQLGRTPGAMIDERLHLEAKRLLFRTTRSISEIAYELEFSSPSHFGSFFKRREGCSPGEARERFATQVSARPTHENEVVPGRKSQNETEALVSQTQPHPLALAG